MKGTTAVWRGKLLNLILQKHGDDEGCTTERAGFEATGIFRARLPTVRRTNGHGSIGAPNPSLEAKKNFKSKEKAWPESREREPQENNLTESSGFELWKMGLSEEEEREHRNACATWKGTSKTAITRTLTVFFVVFFKIKTKSLFSTQPKAFSLLVFLVIYICLYSDGNRKEQSASQFLKWHKQTEWACVWVKLFFSLLFLFFLFFF